MISWILGVFKRTLLFQFFFVFAHYSLNNITKSSHEFRDRYYELEESFNFKCKWMQAFFENPVRGFQLFLGAHVIFALLAVLGSRFFSFVSGLALIFGNVLYHNPLAKSKLQSGKSGNIMANLNVSFEFLLLLALSIAMMALAFKTKCNEKRSEVTEGTVNQETPTQEAGNSATTSKSRDNKPSSKKKKAI